MKASVRDIFVVKAFNFYSFYFFTPDLSPDLLYMSKVLKNIKIEVINYKTNHYFYINGHFYLIHNIVLF